jgi:hypothetical protein
LTRWCRLYSEVLDDPKVQRLPAEDFRGWVNLLCLATRNGGTLPPVSDVAFALRMDEHGTRTLLERLLSGGLLDKRSGGTDGFHYAPHSWAERQYKSDTSTERVKRFRQRNETATETPPETETESETEEGSSEPSAREGKKMIWKEPPVHVPKQVWKDFLENRKRKRLANTPTAYERLIGDLQRVSKASAVEPGVLLTIAAARGWGGIYDPNEKQQGGMNGRGHGATGRTAAAAGAAFGDPSSWTDERPF